MEIAPIFIFGLITFTIFGLLFGSFATMASYRIPRGEELVIKSSHCPACKHSLKWFDLFPLFSWIFSFGKCRYCKVKISSRYPLIELTMGLLFAIIYLNAEISLETIALALMTVALVIMLVMILENNDIPDSILIAMIPIGILYRYSVGSQISEYLPGAVVAICLAAAVRHALIINEKPEYLDLTIVKFIGIAGLFTSFKGLIPLILISGVIGITTYYTMKFLKKTNVLHVIPSLIVAIFICAIFHKYTIDLFSFLN